jgi:hypothetical protein
MDSQKDVSSELLKGCRLKVSENIKLRRIFGPKGGSNRRIEKTT